jgi:streptomycin 6-kinase
MPSVAADLSSAIPRSYREMLAGRPSEGHQDGSAWLRRLPGLLAEVFEHWQLRVDGPSWHGMCAIAVPVRAPAGPAVLKVNWPHHEAEHEHLALKRWDGAGAIRLLAADPSRWALLLEPADAARDLYREPLEQACAVIGGLLRRLTVPALPQLRKLSDEAARLVDAFADLDTIPRRFVDQARSLCAALVTDPAVDASLLHTDLHYWNVLAAGREPWLAIDPKPMAAEPAFGVAPALWNRWEEVVAARSPREHLRLRLQWLCEAGGIDRDRAKAWTIVREVQNALWATEDGDNDRVTIAVTIIKAMQ